MLKFNLKILLRSILNKPVYSLISILGFTFGITASLFIYFWVLDELSFEKFHPNHQVIYRVLTLSKQGDKMVKSATSYGPIAETMSNEYPQIEAATFISYSTEDSPLKTEGVNDKIEARRAWVDESFFNVFQGFEFIEGDSETAFDGSSKIILSEKTAHKLFGENSALGKTLISDKYSPIVYTVGGVIRIPAQSHIDFGFLLSDNVGMGSGYGKTWRRSAHTHTYIKLHRDALIGQRFIKGASAHVSKYSKHTDKLLFQPIADIHLHTDYETYQYDKKISSIKYVWIFSGLALLIILMASLNFASLTTARASERATEIGVRKVNGSGKNSLIWQFITESVLQTFVATIMALILVAIFLPWFGNLTGKEISFSLTFGLVGALLLVIILVGVISGLYPAFYLTSFNPISVFKGGPLTGSKAGFTQSLVLVQFAIAIVLVISTGTIYKQLQFIKDRDLGFDKENIVVIPTGLWYSVGGFKQELLDNPNVKSVSATTQAPLDFSWLSGFHWGGMDSQDTVQASMFWVDEDFAKTYDIEMVKGEFLRQNYADFWKEFKKERKNEKDQAISLPVVINEAFAKEMGVDNPIGMRLNKTHVIVGVSKDFHYRPLHNKISPMVMINDPQNIMTLNVKISENNRAETLNFIGDTYKKHRKGRGFSYSYFEDELEQVYLAENRLASLILKFSLLAVFIAMMGIFGLSTFATQRRIKEIGIRKVNGAKLSEILVLLNRDFIKWVIIAFVIATPLAGYIMNNWMQNFAYKTKLSWWLFAAAGVLALLIALLTVSWQSWRAASKNPIEALRYE